VFYGNDRKIPLEKVGARPCPRHKTQLSHARARAILALPLPGMTRIALKTIGTRPMLRKIMVVCCHQPV
jgi:hypothetical protein